MQPILLLMSVLCCLSNIGLSQSSVKQHTPLDKLPAEGIVLDSGWKFSPGDDIRWADRGYNDSHWKSINPIQQLHKLPEVTKAGIGWFRIKILVDSSLYNKTIAVGITSIGASEFYINGIKAYSFGIVSRSFKNERAHLITDRHFSLQLGNQPIQVLAVRYSFNRKNLYLNFGNAPFCLKLIFKDINNSYRDYLKLTGYQSILRSIQVSFYLPLGLLIFVLYFSFRPRKEYLYFGFFCVFMFAGMAFQFLALINSLSVTETNICLLLSNIFSIAGPIYWLKGIYRLFEERRGWPYRIVLIYGWINIPVYFSWYGWSDILSASFSALATIDFVRLNIIGLRKKKPGSQIFMAMSVTLLGLLLIWTSFLLTEQYLISALLLTICLVVPAAGLAFFIAADFARTGSALIARVEQVEQLSEQTISQENKNNKYCLNKI